MVSDLAIGRSTENTSSLIMENINPYYLVCMYAGMFVHHHHQNKLHSQGMYSYFTDLTYRDDKY